MEELYGYIERITFHNPDNGFTVAWLKAPRQKDLVCVVGTMAAVRPGETVRVSGEWQNHMVHGRQFAAIDCQPEAPSDIVGIKKYLGSGLVKGIGPAYAERIVNFFGEETLRVIDQTPEKLKTIPGIGDKRIDFIKSCWDEQKSIRDVMIFLQSQDISPAFAQKIYKTYGSGCIEVVKENPYALARDMIGIGFKSADKVAKKMGIAKDSPKRVDAGIEFVLSEMSGGGHVCYPLDELTERTREMLEVDADLVALRVESLAKEDRIRLAWIFHSLSDNLDSLSLHLRPQMPSSCRLDNAAWHLRTNPEQHPAQLASRDCEKSKPAKIPVEDGRRVFVWLKALFMSELGIAKELKRIRYAPARLRKVDVDKAVDWVEEKLNIQLAKHQALAVKKSISEKCHIITGGPGTGKSTITHCVLQITEKLTQNIVLAAPTGRAAKRMTEITGRKASTIHSLLEFDFKRGGFKRNRENPLRCDLIIVDEASMIDTVLMNQLLKALPDHARVIFVGDVNQLPSVGPGNVLKDLIETKKIPVTTLNEIFRQARGSKIITNAHRINQGIFPDLETEKESDFFYVECQEPEEVLEKIVSLTTGRLARRYGLDPLHDIQILTPMKRGVIGTENINVVLQEKFNPGGNPLYRAGRKFLVHDKVMQIRNNYDKEVYNGDIGFISFIDHIEQMMIIRFDNRDVEYDFSDLDELILAYAVSIHKSQGSEYPCVLIPVHTTHFIMLHRNLLYTGVTRGKKLVILLGTKKALAIAVQNDEVKLRYTALKDAIRGEIEQIE